MPHTPSEIPDFPGIDPDRLVAAVHELSHALTFRAAGIPVQEIRVYGRGDQAAGHVTVPDGIALTDAQRAALLIGALAGREGDQRFTDLFGLPRWPDRTCAEDMRLYRSERRRLDLTGQSTGHFRAAARRAVRAHWPRILRLAPQLAHRGHIAA